jgi:CRISPR/Cas system CMR-associated protein Cmr1 (group 7 of RAMP superfamily)
MTDSNKTNEKDNIRTFTLKQHTPIIHFQADQPGATLRATELKPKLDKFLIKHAFGGDRKRYERYLIGYSEEKEQEKIDSLKPALDYKVSIAAYGSPEKWYFFGPLNGKKRDHLKNAKVNFIENSSYFAQEQNIFEKVKNSKDYMFKREVLDAITHYGVLHKNIKLSIASFHEKLLEQIDEYIHAFFMVTNFGTRQNKGFGSFTVFRPKPDANAHTLLKKAGYDFFYQKDIGEDVPKKLGWIDESYRLLKSGINNPDRNEYRKSLLFRYFCEKNGVGWEKRRIKEELEQIETEKTIRLFSKNDGGARQGAHGCAKNIFYIRALLGLAEHFEFLLCKNDQGDTDKSDTQEEECKDPDGSRKLVVKVTPDGKIKRFASPLLFKVVDEAIYILPVKIPDIIRQSSYRFDFYKKTKRRGQWITESLDHGFEISAPKIEDDFLEKFLDDANKKGELNMEKISSQNKERQ